MYGRRPIHDSTCRRSLCRPRPLLWSGSGYLTVSSAFFYRAWFFRPRHHCCFWQIRENLKTMEQNILKPCVASVIDHRPFHHTSSSSSCFAGDIFQGESTKYFPPCSRRCHRHLPSIFSFAALVTRRNSNSQVGKRLLFINRRIFNVSDFIFQNFDFRLCC